MNKNLQNYIFLDSFQIDFFLNSIIFTKLFLSFSRCNFHIKTFILKIIQPIH